MNELRNSKSDDQLEELLLLTEQMQEELDQKDRTIRELKMQLGLRAFVWNIEQTI